MKKNTTTFGAEIEKAIINVKTGSPHVVSQNYFEELKKLAKKRKTFEKVHKSDVQPNVSIGVVSKDLGIQGLDNGFNLLETALPVTVSLSDLHKNMHDDLSQTQKALKSEGASIINMSIHPLGK
ncbi:MAG: hypothetical protein KGL95_09605, partial [Patescibacteria group bacterium]|nr:hypothetical protein [Patescibacteria group bacterium]